jgi:sortase A
MAGSFSAWGMVTAPEARDFSFDQPTLLAAPGSALDPVRIAGRVTTSTAAPTTTTTVAETTTTTAAPAPVPVEFPRLADGRPNTGGDKHPDVEIPAIGMIEIPRIGLVHPIFEGLETHEIHWGPGHWPGSAMPGYNGNAVFAGHRVTHTKPFLDIDLLAPGDQMIFRTHDGVFTYEVTGHEIVTPDATWIATPTPDATVTIFACHPKRSAKQRYVVRGRLIASDFD